MFASLSAFFVALRRWYRLRCDHCHRRFGFRESPVGTHGDLFHVACQRAVLAERDARVLGDAALILAATDARRIINGQRVPQTGRKVFDPETGTLYG